MGDFIREAFKSTGIDEKMEEVIAKTILQKWNEEFGSKRPLPSDVPQNIDSSKNNPSAGMIRLITEQLGRRLERKYESKLQKYKDEEEKNIEEKIEKLKIEYKRNLEFAHLQHEEEMRKKEDDFRRKEEILKEESRLEFEKRHLELERAWSEVEAAKKDIRVQKEHLEAAKANFSLKMRNSNLNLERKKDEIAKESIVLEDRERALEEKIKAAVADTKQQEREWIMNKVKEWNSKEAKLIEKCEVLHEKIRLSSKLQTTVNEQASTIRVLESDISSLRERLVDAESRLKDAQHKIRSFSDYETLQEENKRLKEELLSKSKEDVILSKDKEIANLRRRLKLVEETADLRIKELKLRLKNERLHVATNVCKKCHLPNTMKTFGLNGKTHQPVFSETHCLSPLRTESNTSPSASSSSFDRTIRDRLKVIEELSRKLDVSVAEYQSRHVASDHTPVSQKQQIIPNRRLISSAPQPLMTSTPKAKRKPSLKFLSTETSGGETSGARENEDLGTDNSNKLQRISFDETTEHAKSSSRRFLSFNNKTTKDSQRKVNESSSEGPDLSVQQCEGPKKEDDFLQISEADDKPDSPKKNASSSDNGRLDVMFDPVDSDEAQSELEW